MNTARGADSDRAAIIGDQCGFFCETYCPVGFAHGFCVVSDVADVMYKQSNYYADATEQGIAHNDPDVAIEWPFPVEVLIPSQRDATAPWLRDMEAELPFIYGGAGADPLLRRV